MQDHKIAVTDGLDKSNIWGMDSYTMTSTREVLKLFGISVTNYEGRVEALKDKANLSGEDVAAALHARTELENHLIEVLKIVGEIDGLLEKVVRERLSK
jgi:hypothetical protein